MTKLNDDIRGADRRYSINDKPNQAAPSAKGGLTTISPPSKVNTGLPLEPKILSSGVDSLVLALDIHWLDTDFFRFLEYHKSESQNSGKPYPFSIKIPNQNEFLVFNIQPTGTKGYNWLFSSGEYSVRIGNWVEPKSRPSAMIEIRSETLWCRGIREAVDVILKVIESRRAKIKKVKTSRIDLCMDMLIPAHYWDGDLFHNRVTRAVHFAPYFKHRHLTGAMIGKGKLACRIYDKLLEIQTQSKKTWMFDVWGTSTIQDNEKIIRVEFQLWRETLKSLRIDTIEETLASLENLWAYCTQNWLKFQTNPEKHHTQQKLLPWWRTVQDSFLGIPEPTPAIRAKSINTSQSQLAHQAVGLVTALAATHVTEGPDPFFKDISHLDLVQVFRKAIRLTGKSKAELLDAVNLKKAKNYKGKVKYLTANWKRLQKDLPADLISLMLEEDILREDSYDPS